MFSLVWLYTVALLHSFQSFRTLTSIAIVTFSAISLQLVPVHKVSIQIEENSLKSIPVVLTWNVSKEKTFILVLEKV